MAWPDLTCPALTALLLRLLLELTACCHSAKPPHSPAAAAVAPTASAYLASNPVQTRSRQDRTGQDSTPASDTSVGRRISHTRRPHRVASTARVRLASPPSTAGPRCGESCIHAESRRALLLPTRPFGPCQHSHPRLARQTHRSTAASYYLLAGAPACRRRQLDSTCTFLASTVVPQLQGCELTWWPANH